MTVRPPTQPPAEPLITVELSYIINVSRGQAGHPGHISTLVTGGLWDGQVGWAESLTCVEVVPAWPEHTPVSYLPGYHGSSLRQLGLLQSVS